MIVLVLTIIRLIGLTLSSAELYPDEAQYWSWAQAPAWGYFSKPPMVAWLIAVAEPLCGSGAACVRAPFPLLWAATAMAAFATGACLRGGRAGFWAGLLVLLAPGAILSARTASTDAPLLLFWSLALLAWVRLRGGGGRGWAILLAAALGLGLLSKYAMIYFVLLLPVAAVVDPGSRAVLRHPLIWLALAVGAAMLTPNVIWNLDHGLATFRHTGQNIGGDGLRVDPLGAIGFLAAQIGVLGPAVAFGLGSVAAGWRRADAESRLLLAMSAPVVVVIAAVALTERANANWAAVGLIAGAVLGAQALLKPGRSGWRIAAVVFGLVTQTVMLAGDMSAARLSLFGGSPYRDTLGWTALGQAVDRGARGAGVTTVVTERRRDTAGLLYVLRNRPLRVTTWPAEGKPRDHFELTRPLPPTGGPVLALTECADLARFAGVYERATIADAFDIHAGPTRVRHWRLVRLDGARGPRSRPGACPSN